MPLRKKIGIPFIAVISLTVGLTSGIFYGKRNPSLDGAVNRVAEEMSSWRLNSFSSDLSDVGKIGFWASPFQTRFSGTSEESIFMTEDKSVYILLTKQERITKKTGPIIVVENPAGFFNGKFSAPFPHAWAEEIERDAEKAFKQDQQKHRKHLYNTQIPLFKEREQSGETWPVYVEDSSLTDTGVRETFEETGFNPKDFEASLISKNYPDPFETPTVFVMRVKKFYKGPLPPLKIPHDGEVLDAKWVCLGHYDTHNQFIRDSNLHKINEGKIMFGEELLPIKPLDYLMDNMIGTLNHLEKNDPYGLKR